MVDEDGSKAAELRYKAWGETRFTPGSASAYYRYTAQREEAGIGLYYYRAGGERALSRAKRGEGTRCWGGSPRRRSLP